MTGEHIARPITPQEAMVGQHIPEDVILAVNGLLAEMVVEGRASIGQDDLVDRLVERGIERSTIFEKGLLNFEGMYRAAGWKVTYDKPGFNESYRPSFIFEATSPK